MISDKTLMRVSVAVSAIGVIALFLIATFLGPTRASIGGLKLGENVLIGGVVHDYSESKGNVFFTLVNDSSVRVVVFAQDAERLPQIIDGDSVTVTGKVQLYRGDIEIIAKDVRQG